MPDFKIAVIPGDGIGNEVTPAGIRILNSVSDLFGTFRLEYEYFPWGCEYYLTHGQMMAEDGLKILKNFDAIYFGAVGYPTVPDHISLRGLRLPICQGFEQYICFRPSTYIPGVHSPLVGNKVRDIDFVVIRENTEGEYVGAGGRAHTGLQNEIAIETALFSRQGTERVMHYAFKLAQKRNKKLISATKSNAQQHTMTFWDEIFEQVAQGYADVNTERVLIDALAARFVLSPESLDVVVASNLFGDILTDLGAAICGSLGIAPSANINPEKDYPSMFEPVHGSAPEIAGTGIANPIGMIRCGALMLDFLGESEAADLIEASVHDVLKDQKWHTPDLGGRSKTQQVTDALIKRILERVKKRPPESY
jgi:tartrate dehydrogenase/decarboxylase/D-malate dehydrogenase